MPRTRSGDTKARIQQAALDLFAAKGLRQTSLRDIADRLGMTKPALYYHFASRDELVSSLAKPLIDDFDAYVDAREAEVAPDPRELLGSFFDLTYRHRGLLLLALRDLSVLQEMHLTDHVTGWRRRIVALLIGESPSLADQVRGMVAIGGLSDCAVVFEGVDVDELRTAAVDAAYDTLGR
ncbi:TetR family transcriptional regulator [Kribbella amoyensis]|uniref:TetR family transcriptional regulator n=1 Tax=Kribbella amoyensis TaxID=996641 RepID=A0A561BVR0_9ACTN|nr:TetR/AcrR family transcriptional regulator [Kribbella amoyensis]TWD82980.1 TetR family transcriptional regulator [Kribbella amoyensis]